MHTNTDQEWDCLRSSLLLLLMKIARDPRLHLSLSLPLVFSSRCLRRMTSWPSGMAFVSDDHEDAVFFHEHTIKDYGISFAH